ncbi:unnamed protein product [Timema podura]|uniref:Uncharacterized protein n=1 Tax=Timema podura TaxID=61482 RepID=A0ABN7P8B0_TIMPD|nr:unnamed protein product [Timema podura]
MCHDSYTAVTCERTKRTLEKQTSTSTLEETYNVSDAGKPPPACPPLPPHLFTVDRTRPLSLTSEDLAHLFQSVQVHTLTTIPSRTITEVTTESIGTLHFSCLVRVYTTSLNVVPDVGPL